MLHVWSPTTSFTPALDGMLGAVSALRKRTSFLVHFVIIKPFVVSIPCLSQEQSEESDGQEVDSKCEVASNEDEDFVIGDEEEDDDDVTSRTNTVGTGISDLRVCTSEGESTRTCLKASRELHTLNKSVEVREVQTMIQMMLAYKFFL